MAQDSPDHEIRAISRYVESQGAGEVLHAERITSSRILGRCHEVWDVHCKDDRYWVITNLTNLYSQTRFRSMDETLSFHVGVMLRLNERESNTPEDENRDLLGSAWRIYEQAVKSMDHAIEAEDFEAIGIRCRDSLIASARNAISGTPDIELQDRPKAGDFKNWVNALAAQLVTKRARAYLISLAEITWNLVVALGHNSRASESDAELALDATAHFLNMFGVLLLRAKREGPKRCPQCESVQMSIDYRDDYANKDHPWYVVCSACNSIWSDPPF